MNHFEVEDTIFDSEEPLTEYYEPETLHGREEELDKLADSLSWAVRGAPPKNVLVKGGQGTGKTEAVNRILRQLNEKMEEEAEEGLTTVSVQCRNHPTEYQISIKIVNKLRKQRGNTELMTGTGYSGSAVQEALFQELDIHGGIVIVVLEEIDHVDEGELDGLIYNLSRAAPQGEVENCKPAFIGISNDYSIDSRLNVETADSLRVDQISFGDYDAHDLQNILRPRVEKALRESAYGESIVPYIAANSKEDQGSARRAIKLAHKAAEVAKEVGDNEITPSHVDTAQKRLDRKHLINGITSMDRQSHLVLATIVTRCDLPVTKSELYPEYQTMAESFGHKPLSERRMKDRLDNLARRAILESTESGVIKYDLRVHTEILKESLATTEFDSVCEYI